MLKRFLQIYQTSSPSYLLMAGIDNALDVMEREGSQRFGAFRCAWEKMLARLSACENLRFLQGDYTVQDVGKLVISVRNTSLTGKQLYRILLEQYHLQPEMAAEDYVLAMFTVNDTAEGFERMTEALLEIDRQLPKGDRTPQKGLREMEKESAALTLAEAWDGETCLLKLSESIGRVSGEFINLYPPGIPLLVPGEIITKELCGKILKWNAQGLTVQGILTRGEEILVRVLV
jgi:arginine/lysine/ornithine decarboxylase